MSILGAIRRRIHRLARRWFPELVIRVTRGDVERAKRHLDELSETKIEEGRRAAERVRAAARPRNPVVPGADAPERDPPS